jgi:hypothetical protein
LALSWSLARFQLGARILTFVVDAGEFSRTLAVFSTFGLLFLLAVDVRVAEVSAGASAEGDVVLHATLSSRRARVVVHARVDTLGVDTLPVGRTVAVGGTPDDSTSLQWISSITAAAATFGAVLVDVTLGVDSARIFNQTRIDAVAVDARLSRLAFGIDSAAHVSTRYVGVTLETFLARTDGSMVLDEASRVGAAVTRIATEPIDASFVGGTVTVRGTTRRNWYHDGVTLAVIVRDPSFRTSTDHGSDGHGVQDAAVSRAVARRETLARIDAFVLDASQFAGTVYVEFAFWTVQNCRHAIGLRVSFRKVWWTDTTRGVVLSVAHGVLGARRVGHAGARVDAALF